MDGFFTIAQPVWTKEKRGEMNVTCLFSAKAEKGKTKIRVTACNFYRMFVGGKFFGYGPARAAKGYARVDEYEFDSGEETVIVFEVAGYRSNTFYCMNEEPFWQAEILSGERVVKATGREGDFSCRVLSERVQKVARFSYQRPFSESYVYRKPLNLVYGEVRDSCGTEILPQKKLLPRGVSYPIYDRCAACFTECGTFDDQGAEPPMRDRFLTMSELGIFPIAALETLPSDDLASFRYVLSEKEKYTGKLSAGEYAVYSFARKVGQALAGGIGGFALSAIGYVSEAASQPNEVAERIYTVATLVPGACFLIVFLIMQFAYPLNRRSVEHNSKVLAERRRSGEAHEKGEADDRV